MCPLCDANCAIWLLLPLLFGLLAGWWAWGRRPTLDANGNYDASPSNADVQTPAAFVEAGANSSGGTGNVLGDGAPNAPASVAGGAVAAAALAGGAAVAAAVGEDDHSTDSKGKAKGAKGKSAKTKGKAPASTATAKLAKGGLKSVGGTKAAVGAVALTSIGIPAAVGTPDDLLKIKGIGPKLNGVLNGLGVTRFDQIAAWKKGDVDKVDDHLAQFKGRIGQEEWIAQAKLLAKGKNAEWERIYGTVKKAAGAAVALLAIGIPGAAGDPDDLLQIKGIGPKLNTLLVGLGITRFDQIAAWGAGEIDKVDDHLGTFKNRITRDSWVEQAGLLAKGKIKEFEAKFGKLDSENK